jgi:bifunctional DNA-binding transcriptional regulator/antitoxin component of YhaV-PrlF toxin-antitoxin module
VLRPALAGSAVTARTQIVLPVAIRQLTGIGERVR